MIDFQFFTPGTNFELLEDAVIPDINEPGFWWLRVLEGINTYRPSGSPPVPAHPYTLPAGTVIKLINFRASAYSSHANVFVVWSPDKRLMPKCRGGTGRRIQFQPKIPILNAMGMKVKVVP